MGGIDLHDVKDVISIIEQVSTRDIGGFNIENFQIAVTLSEEQVVTHSQDLLHNPLGRDNFEWNEWLTEEISHFVYMKV
jgi:hypothetical protein